jgi:hypothetical protein
MYRSAAGRELACLAQQFQQIKTGRAGVRGLVRLLYGILAGGKVVETISFSLWELSFRLGLMRRIEFDDNVVLDPGSDWTQIGARLSASGSLGLRVARHRHSWKQIFFGAEGKGYGCSCESPRDLYLQETDQRIRLLQSFPVEILAIYVSAESVVFVSLGDGSIHRSLDAGSTFSVSLLLATDKSFLRFDHGMTETPDGQLIVGEYGNVPRGVRWESIAFLYYSNDQGGSWRRSDILIQRGANKHVHLVRYSRLIDAVILTDGDNKKRIWKSKPRSDRSGQLEWELMNRFHLQTGGYTSMVELEEKLLFGTDYHGGTNFVVETRDGRKLSRSAVPDPYRRCPIFGMAKRSSASGVEVWATLHNSVDPKVKSLLMCTRNAGRSWTRVIEYDGTRHRIHLVSAANKLQKTIYFHVTALVAGAERGLATFKVADPTQSLRR